jgi:pullulanase
MGSTLDGSSQANQSNISKIVPTETAIGGIAVFNDVIRDGLKGSVFEKTGRGYINGSSKGTLSKILFGIRGGQGMGHGWTVENQMVINYMSAHDNNTLWDKLLLSNPGNTEEERVRMNRLGAAILMISRGTPFWQAGEEMLRTKGGDENSYQSSDAVNNIDWSVLRDGTLQYETMLYYKGLIEMRKAYDIFYNSEEISHTDLGNGAVAVTFSDANGCAALAVINPNSTALSYTLDGDWNLVADSDRAGQSVLATESGLVTLNGISIRIYVNDTLIS